eukprot:4997307-Prymnesium_polylepis.1
MRCDRATLFTINPADDMSPELHSNLLNFNFTIKVKVNQRSIAGSTVASNATQNVHDAYVDSRFDPFWDHKNGYRTHSILCAPIRTFENPDVRFGCVQLINKMGITGGFNGAVFQQMDIKVLNEFCDRVARSFEAAAGDREVWSVHSTGKFIHRVLAPADD